MNSEGLPLIDLSPGRLVGDRFRVVQAHRQGGMSVAFEVQDEQNGERRELQLFSSSLFDLPEQAAEVCAALIPWKNVDNDAILRVCEVTLIGQSTLAVITEYPQGESLRRHLKERGRLTQGETVAIGCQLLEGLATVHEHSLVHGDVKPSTIHLLVRDDDLQVTLVDGGVTPALWEAKDLGEKTALIGTPYYAPIEQFGGDSPNVQSDLYNVAAVLFECVTGVLPWAGTSFVEVFQNKLDRRPPSMKARAPDVAVDPELERVIVTGCLAERGERYSSAEAFLAELSPLTDL